MRIKIVGLSTSPTLIILRININPIIIKKNPAAIRIPPNNLDALYIKDKNSNLFILLSLSLISDSVFSNSAFNFWKIARESLILVSITSLVLTNLSYSGLM